MVSFLLQNMKKLTDLLYFKTILGIQIVVFVLF